MASQDYKSRNKNTRKRPSQKSGSAFKWMLITGLVIGLVVFAVYLKGTGLKKIKRQLEQHPITTPVVQSVLPQGLSSEMARQLEQQPDITLSPEAVNELEHDAPQFDFYTILPDKDVVVPDHEIITRTREERVAAPPVDSVTTDTQTKPTIAYMMQAGSFKDAVDAEKLRSNLASMGIESRVERAKVGEVVWHRIKMGPYTQMSSVSAIRARLRQNGIDVIVTETGVR